MSVERDKGLEAKAEGKREPEKTPTEDIKPEESREEDKQPKEQEAKDRRQIIVTEVGGNTFGIVVDSVIGVERLPPEDIKPVPQTIQERLEGAYMTGVGVQGDNQLIILLDLAKVLAEK